MAEGGRAGNPQTRGIEVPLDPPEPSEAWLARHGIPAPPPFRPFRFDLGVSEHATDAALAVAGVSVESFKRWAAKCFPGEPLTLTVKVAYLRSHHIPIPGNAAEQQD